MFYDLCLTTNILISGLLYLRFMYNSPGFWRQEDSYHLLSHALSDIFLCLASAKLAVNNDECGLAKE